MLRYRTLLPFTNSALFLLLIWFGCPYWLTWESWARPTTKVADGWYPAFIDGPPSWLEQIANGLNFPVVYAIHLMLIPVTNRVQTGAGLELILHISTALCIPIFWYFVGRAIDYRSPPGSVGARGSTTMTMVGLGLLSVAVAVLMASLFQPSQVEFTLERILVLAWLGVGIVLLSKRIGRRHVPT